LGARERYVEQKWRGPVEACPMGQLPTTCVLHGHCGLGQGCIRREGTSEGGPRSGWRRLPKRLGAVTVGYKCH
jgi:hypothetical protein